jgi:hypothetical protein
LLNDLRSKGAAKLCAAGWEPFKNQTPAKLHALQCVRNWKPKQEQETCRRSKLKNGAIAWDEEAERTECGWHKEEAYDEKQRFVCCRVVTVDLGMNFAGHLALLSPPYSKRG